MEVLKYNDILGMVTSTDVYEGRMVMIGPLGTALLPSTAAEAALAKYLIAWPVENRQLPIYQPYPTYTRALRYGFDQTANIPFNPTLVYTLYPNLSMEPLSIPSGNGALLYEEGEFIVTSGNWVFDPAMVPGLPLEVAYTGATAGKLQIKNAGTAVAVCTGVPSGQKLQFRTYGE